MGEEADTLGGSEFERDDPALTPLVRADGKVGDRVAAGAAMLYGTSLLLRVLQLATTLILARVLTPADYGIVALAATIVGVLDTMSDLQVGGAIIRAKNMDGQFLDTAFTITLCRGLLTGTLLAVLAHPLAMAFHNSQLEAVLYVLALTSVINGIHNPYFSLFERNLEFHQESWRAALASILGAVVGISLALLFRSYWALVAGTVSRSIFNMAMSYVQTPGRPKLSVKRFSEIFHFGGWLTLIGLINYVNNRVDYFLVGSLNSAKLGAYHLGEQVTSMATGDVVGPLSRALFPAFAMFADDPDRLKSSYRRAQVVVIGLALPIGFGTSALASEIIPLLVGPQWLLAIPVVEWLAPMIALQTLTVSTDSMAYALGETKSLFRRSVFLIVIRAVLLFAGFSLAGFMGIIYARIISGAVYLIYHLALAGRLTRSPLWIPFAAGWRSFIATTAMWGSLALMPKFAVVQSHAVGAVLALGMQIAVGAIIYLGVHLSLWLAVGRPEGFETRMLSEVRKLSARAYIRV